MNRYTEWTVDARARQIAWVAAGVLCGALIVFVYVVLPEIGPR